MPSSVQDQHMHSGSESEVFSTPLSFPLTSTGLVSNFWTINWCKIVVQRAQHQLQGKNQLASHHFKLMKASRGLTLATTKCSLHIGTATTGMKFTFLTRWNSRMWGRSFHREGLALVEGKKKRSSLNSGAPQSLTVQSHCTKTIHKISIYSNTNLQEGKYTQ